MTPASRGTLDSTQDRRSRQRERDMARAWDRAKAAVAALYVAVLGMAAPAAGQVATDEGVWTAVSLRGRVTADAGWRWGADTLVQSRDGVRTLDQALEHVWVTRDVGQGVAIGFGYAVGA